MTANGEPFYFYTNTHIAVIPAAGGEPRIVTAKFDEDPSLIDWGPDGIYFAAFLKCNAHVFRVNPETLAIQRISSPDAFFVPDASFTPDHRMFAAVGAAAESFFRSFRFLRQGFRAKISHQHERAMEGFPAHHARSDRVEIDGRHAHPRRSDEARRLRSIAEISVAGGDSRRAHGLRHAGGSGRPVLSHGALCRQGRADFEAELSRLGGVRRKIPVAQRPQSRHRRLSGCDFRRGFSGRQRAGG